jgi:hypothetical protein
MLALSDQQLKTVETAAALLPVNARDTFLRSIANRLSDIATPSDHDVATAVSFVLNTRGVSAPLFLCDAAPTKQPHAQRKVFSQRYSKSQFGENDEKT